MQASIVALSLDRIWDIMFTRTTLKPGYSALCMPDYPLLSDYLLIQPCVWPPGLFISVRSISVQAEPSKLLRINPIFSPGLWIYLRLMMTTK